MPKLKGVPLVALVGLLGLVVVAVPGAGANGDAASGQRRQIVPFSEGIAVGAKLAAGNDSEFAGIGTGSVDNSTCPSSGDPAGNIDLSCDQPFGPENETPIVVNPVNPDHLLAGSNDYWLSRKGNGTLRFIEPTGFFVSFDGGSTWIDGQVPMLGATHQAGDPSPAFNRKFGTAHMAQLAIACGAQCGAISLNVATSHDGGLRWDVPVIVAQGQGSVTPSPRGVFNDKEWLVADNNPSSPYYGRLYMSWTRLHGTDASVDAPIYISYSDDDGRSWTSGKEISGSNPALCTFTVAGAPGRCSQDSFSVPVVLADGTIVVHFQNYQNSTIWESPEEFDTQLLAVRSVDGGQTWSAPVQNATLEDGLGDYPINVDGRSTQTGHQFRTQGVAGMTLDEFTGDLWAFWADNTDGVRDGGGVAVTKTNVFVARSADGGLTWSAPIRVTAGDGDRWMPWAAARSGVLRVMYMDGAYDFPNRDKYGITLSMSTDGGTTWTHEAVHTALSNPDKARFFRAGSAAPGCERCSTFIGDYAGMAVDSVGRFHLIWTDLRREVTFNNRSGNIEDIMYARR